MGGRVTETLGKWIGLNFQLGYQLVLISSDSSKLGLRKDKSSVFFLLYICYRSVDSISSFNQIDSRLEFVHRVQYYLSGVIRLIVGDLDLFKSNHLFFQLFSGKRSIGMTIQTMGWSRIGLASDKPRGAVVGVSVPFVVAGHDVEHHHVLGARLQV